MRPRVSTVGQVGAKAKRVERGGEREREGAEREREL